MNSGPQNRMAQYGMFWKHWCHSNHHCLVCFSLSDLLLRQSQNNSLSPGGKAGDRHGSALWSNEWQGKTYRRSRIRGSLGTRIAYTWLVKEWGYAAVDSLLKWLMAVIHSAHLILQVYHLKLRLTYEIKEHQKLQIFYWVVQWVSKCKEKTEKERSGRWYPGLTPRWVMASVLLVAKFSLRFSSLAGCRQCLEMLQPIERPSCLKQKDTYIGTDQEWYYIGLDMPLWSGLAIPKVISWLRRGTCQKSSCGPLEKSFRLRAIDSTCQMNIVPADL